MRHFIILEKAVQKVDDPMKFCNSQCIQQRVEDILTSSTFSNADYDIVISFLAAKLFQMHRGLGWFKIIMTIAKSIKRKTIYQQLN